VYEVSTEPISVTITQPAVYTVTVGDLGGSVTQTLLGQTFETISKNLKGYPATITYSSGQIATIVYTIATGNITKTLAYSSGNVSTIVLSGGTPSGISLTKTLTYTSGDLTGVAYS
jgi:hypothetical protein